MASKKKDEQIKNPSQQEMFPDHVKEQLPPGRKPSVDSVVIRKETRSLNQKEAWQKITVPAWVKEKRNRGTKSNLDEDIEEDPE